MEQALRLFERIYTTSDYFYININIFNKQSKEFWEKTFENYKNKKNIKFIFKQTKSGESWGTDYLIKWTIEGMNYFSSFDYDYFVNLSNHCYPIKSIDKIKMELGKKSTAYLGYFTLPGPERWSGNGGLDRIHYFHFKYGNKFYRFPRLIKKLPNNLKPYGGSTWLCLHKKFVDYILEYVSKNPKILRFYEYSFVPDEMIFQTIIMNSPLADIDPIIY